MDREWLEPWRLVKEYHFDFTMVWWKRKYLTDCDCHPCQLSKKPIRLEKVASVCVEYVPGSCW